MRRLLGMLTVFLPVVLFVARLAMADEDVMQFGKAVNGVRLGIAVKPSGKKEFHPGELIRVDGELKPQRAMRLPDDSVDHFLEIHVQMPGGEDCVWGEFFHPRQAETLRPSSTGSLLVTHMLRLDMRRDWVQPNGQPLTDAKGQPREISLRTPGKYRMWAICQSSDRPESEHPSDAWQGRVTSGIVEWEITDLPPAKRFQNVTDEQAQLVDQWLSSKQPLPVHATPDLDNRLVLEALETENEGLANRLLQVLKDNASANHRFEALRLLNLRAGSATKGELGIDGPYLRPLAEWELDLVEGKVQWLPAKEADRDETFWNLWYLSGDRLLDGAFAYLAFHPDDQTIRNRILAVCEVGGRLNGQNTVAFRVLQQLAVLRPGMKLADAVKVLGPPGRQTLDSAEWYWYPPSRPSIALRPYHWVISCKLKNQTTVEDFQLNCL